MSNKQFISNLSSTYADVRKLDVKKINLKGKNILEYIEESIPTIKHSKDTRETVYTDDLWGQWVETKDDGTVVIHDDYLSNPNGSSAWLENVKAVQDNKAYSEITTDTDGNFLGVDEDSVVANIQTEMIKDGSYMFSRTLTSFNGDLSNLVNGYSMFASTTLTSFNSDLSNLINGQDMFSGAKITSFDANLSSLVNGNGMFFYTTSLTSFTSDLSSLVGGQRMFYYTSLESFNSDLNILVDGTLMFYRSSLESFTSDLSSLTNGQMMFSYTTSLESFTSDLNSLTNGNMMFYQSSLESFSGDLSSLVQGGGMFERTALTSFNSDLSSLVSGVNMFQRCKLSPQSVMYIVESIRNITEEKAKYTNGEIPWVTYDSTTRKYSKPFGFRESGNYVYTYNDPNPYTTTISSSRVGQLTLGIDVTNDSETIDQQLQTFAEGCLCDSWAELKQEFVDKGWTVTFQYGGSSNEITNTYDLRNGEQIIPCPIFAKLVQVEDEDKADYCTEDASTFYNIEWGHDVTDTSSYTQFNSLEDAMTSWNVFPKENIISTEEEEA